VKEGRAKGVRRGTKKMEGGKDWMGGGKGIKVICPPISKTD